MTEAGKEYHELTQAHEVRMQPIEVCGSLPSPSVQEQIDLRARWLRKTEVGHHQALLEGEIRSFTVLLQRTIAKEDSILGSAVRKAGLRNEVFEQLDAKLGAGWDRAPEEEPDMTQEEVDTEMQTKQDGEAGWIRIEYQGRDYTQDPETTAWFFVASTGRNKEPVTQQMAAIFDNIKKQEELRKEDGSNGNT